MPLILSFQAIFFQKRRKIRFHQAESNQQPLDLSKINQSLFFFIKSKQIQKIASPLDL